MAQVKLTSTQRRKYRVRNRIRATALKQGKPRLSVHRTGQHMHVQLIDDAQGKTLASASTMDADIKKGLKSTSNVDAATAVGKAIAEKAKAAKVKTVIFDRGQFLYHGRVKAVAEAAREGGLEF
jgi:large subunit ribosomal protein L18